MQLKNVVPEKVDSKLLQDVKQVHCHTIPSPELLAQFGQGAFLDRPLGRTWPPKNAFCEGLQSPCRLQIYLGHYHHGTPGGALEIDAPFGDDHVSSM